MDFNLFLAVVMDRDSRIFVAGARGMVGSAIIRNLEQKGFGNILKPLKSELDLLDQAGVMSFFEREKPDYVFVAAARVGGIYANNTYQGQFIYENLQIQNNVIHSAYLAGVKKLLFLGSSCIYPRFADQPMKEEYLLTGALEPTNEPYAVAKIAGLVMCRSYRRQYGCDFISAMPTNLYGPGDNFNLESSHVIPALIRKFHEAKQGGAKEVDVWGTGNPRREFLHVDDLAEACVFLMGNYSEEMFINVGCGEDISIRDLAELIGNIIGYGGGVRFDESKPDGTPKKLLDVSRLSAMGWAPNINIEDGLRNVYDWFLSNQVRY